MKTLFVVGMNQPQVAPRKKKTNEVRKYFRIPKAVFPHLKTLGVQIEHQVHWGEKYFQHVGKRIIKKVSKEENYHFIVIVPAEDLIKLQDPEHPKFMMILRGMTHKVFEKVICVADDDALMSGLHYAKYFPQEHKIGFTGLFYEKKSATKNRATKSIHLQSHNKAHRKGA